MHPTRIRGYTMKRIYLLMIIAIAATITSCTSPKAITTINAFNQSVNQVKSELEAKGYTAIGETKESKNEIYVSGTSYSKYSGYGTEMKNNVWDYSTYQFQDTTGNRIEMQLKYKSGTDYNKGAYVCNVSLLGCSCTKNADYNKVCGANGVADILRNMPNDEEIQEFDVLKTTLLGSGIALAISLLPLLML